MCLPKYLFTNELKLNCNKFSIARGCRGVNIVSILVGNVWPEEISKISYILCTAQQQDGQFV